MPRTTAEQPYRRPDASMDLLTQVIDEAIDPEYATATAAQSRRPPTGSARRRNRAAFLAAVAVIAALFTIAGAETTRERPAIAQERQELITRIDRAESQRDQRLEQVDRLAAENARLRTAGLGDDARDRRLAAELRQAEAAVGVTPVRGPGITVITDDAAGGDQVIDVDLQILVNGLWGAGAEAVQINGHRVTSLTAIRHAGEAITVNYRSVNPPYRVDAIGDQRTLQPRLLESAAGTWWNSLAQNQGLRYDVSDADALTVSGIPGLTVRTATEHRS